MRFVVACIFCFATLINLSGRCQANWVDGDVAVSNLQHRFALDAVENVANCWHGRRSLHDALCVARGGGWLIPAGYNPFGYKITSLGEEFLSYEGSLDSDVGRFLASLKSERKRFATLKGQWLEVLRVSKAGQSMRIYKNLEALLALCLKMGLID
jgi:hypothetical protein